MAKSRKSADKNLIRRLNIALVLNYLRTSQRRTRASLAASTGLTRATVSSLVDNLIALNLVRETGLQPSQGGRPGTRLELNPSGGCAIGIEIGVGFVTVVLADFVANVRWRQRVEVGSRDFKEVITVAEQLVDHAEHQSKALSLNLLGIGVGLPGLVKIDEGLLRFAPNLSWYDIPFQALWQERFGVPVYAINDASAAALGEHYFGIAANYDDFIYLRLNAIGLGAGIMLGGALFQGVNGYAGEVGHMVLDPAGPQCACGRHGCWETFAGLEAVTRYILEQARTGRPSNALNLLKENANALTPSVIAQAIEEKDPMVEEALAHYCQMFVIGVVNLINTLNPQLIVVGGALNNLIAPYLTRLEETINQQALRALADKVEIKLSSLDDDACLMGTVAAVLDVVFSNPAQSVEHSRP